jgi:hypothetical protein
MAAALMPDRPAPTLAFGEIITFAYDTFCGNKVRFILTALGMVIGTASLILVVTIGMTGRQFVLAQIQAIGTNEIWAEYLGGAPHIRCTRHRRFFPCHPILRTHPHGQWP